MVELYYLGERVYVNGLTLIEKMIEQFFESAPRFRSSNLLIQKFKVNSFVTHACRFETYTKSEKPSAAHLRKACSRIDLMVEGEQHILLFFEEEDHKTELRLPDYDRTQYLESIEPDGRGGAYARFSQRIEKSYEITRAVVEVSHQLSIAESRANGVESTPSWAYLLNFPMVPDHETNRLNAVRFERKGEQLAFDRKFLLYTGQLEGAFEDQEFEICYFTRDPNAAASQPH